ncbi:MAG: hypothetical protein DRN25_05840, partial [Thermoplasmata archaeon]
MGREIRSKTLAMFVVLTMLMTAVTTIHYVLNIEMIGSANATMGVDEWQENKDGGDILNISTDELYYGNTVTLKFNGSVIQDTCYLYKPNYKRAWNSGIGDYVYYINWTRVASIDPTVDEPQITNLNLDRAGLWLVVEDNAPYLDKFNMSNMSYYDVSGSAWEDIIGWFWVNSTSWTIDLSVDEVTYDANNSLTVTVKYSNGGTVDKPFWIDVWKLDGAKDFNDAGAKLVYHKEV